MSLETQIQTLTEAIDNLAFIIKQQAILAQAAPAPLVAPAPAVTIVPEPEPKPIPIVEVFPTPAPAPVVEIVAAPAPVEMPALPTFMAAPVASPASTTKAPFSDAKGLMAYVMESYKTLGPVKGSEIQNILVKLGYQNINDIRAEHYDALFAGVEALK